MLVKGATGCIVTLWQLMLGCPGNFECDVGKGTLRWRHNGRDCVSNHQPYDCLLNRLFRRKSKKTSKLRVTGLCAGNSPGTGEFPAQMASYAENVSIWWRHHDFTASTCTVCTYTWVGNAWVRPVTHVAMTSSFPVQRHILPLPYLAGI